MLPSAPFTHYLKYCPYLSQMKQTPLPALTLCYNIVHLSRVKETHSSGNASENLTVNSHGALESHFSFQSYKKKQKKKTRPCFGSSYAVCVSGVINGLHHSHSQPQPKLITGLAGPVFIVGLTTAHARFSICSSFMKEPLRQSPRSQVKEE